MMMGGFFFMVILAAVVVALLVWGTSTSGRPFWVRGDQNPEERSALQILEDRFARGEIDREEFERRRAILTRR
jgi:putative membrane protein